MSEPDVDGGIVFQFQNPFTVLREEEPGYLLGEMNINGTPFHVEAIRVVEDEDRVQVAWKDDENNNRERHALLLDYGKGDFCTTEIPGFEGDYVLVVTPFGN